MPNQTMTAPILLPTPLAPTSLTLGQLLVDPLDPTSTSYLSSSKPTLQSPQIQSQYKDVLTHDTTGHLLTPLTTPPTTLQSNLLLLQAQSSTYTSLQNPDQSFNALRNDPSARLFLRKQALRNKPLYYITGLQKLTNPTFKRAVVTSTGSIAEVNSSSSTAANQDPKLRLPMHVRRDSAMDMEDTTASEAVFAIQVRKVMCHVGAPEEPHSLEDIGYEWSYHAARGNRDDQLSIGLGKMLGVGELRALAGIEGDDEELTDESYEFDDSDSEGFGGF